MIIGISGKKGHGKDTTGIIFGKLLTVEKRRHTVSSVYGYLQERSDTDLVGDWKIKRFGDKLKEIASIITGIDRRLFESQDFKNMNLSEVTKEDWRYYKVNVDGKKVLHPVHTSRHMIDRIKKNHHVELVDPTVRHFLQNLGTEAIRNNIHPNTWAKALFADYKEVDIPHIN